MSFGKIFGDTWDGYFSNWKVFTKFLLIFILIPSVMLGILSSYAQVNPANLLLQFVSGIFGILVFGLFILASVGIIYEVIKGKKGKYKYNRMISGGKEYFWRYLGFILLISIILVGIAIVLLIPFILSYSNHLLRVVVGAISIIALVLVIVYLFIRWTFTPYILIDENKKVMESFSASSNFVRGRWGKIFGYFLAIGLIIVTFEIVILLITEVIKLLISIPFEDMVIIVDEIKVYPLKIQLARNIISSASSSIINIITIPFGALFTKNLYFFLKKNK